MMEKKRMAALLAAVLFGMSAIPAGAVNLIDTDAAATDSAEHAELDLYGVRATVTDRQDGELTVSNDTTKEPKDFAAELATSIAFDDQGKIK